MKKKLIGLVLMFSIVVSTAFAQKTQIYTNKEADYKAALELFQKEKYSAAQADFKKVYRSIKDPHSEIKMNAEYYIAMCALKLFNKDSEYLFINFIKNHPHNPKVRKARFYLGVYNYRKHNYTKTIEWFAQVDENDLEEEEISEFRFKYGYSHFKKKEYVEAQKQFHLVKQDSSDYAGPGLFYYSHLAYKFEHYETALIGFKNLSNDDVFGKVVPYYISQIYYLQKKFDLLVEYAEPLLNEKESNPKRSHEIARLIGEGYYNLNKYEKALPYLERWYRTAANKRNEDIYQLAYTYYKVKNYEEAIKKFQRIVDRESEIGQLALYYLGDSYLQLGNKEGARNAFRFASKSHIDPIITEYALFNFAKLSYELSLDPYHEAIYAFENFIKKYPNSERIDEANKYLLDVYLTTNDYRKALKAIDKIKNKGPELEYAYQRIAYFRGIELFNDEKLVVARKNRNNFTAAIHYFDKSLEYDVDQKIVALAHYWKGEALYRDGKYNEAIASYKEFLNKPGAIVLPEYKDVYYNIGYAYFFMDDPDYQNAAANLRIFIRENSGEKTKKTNDALIRIGDSYLKTGVDQVIRGNKEKAGFELAIKYYRQALSQNVIKQDYVLFNMSVAYQLAKKDREQIDALSTLVKKYPNSMYADDAMYELGSAYVKLEETENAKKSFQKIIADYSSNSQLVQKAYFRLGLIYWNANDNKKALESMELGIKENPNATDIKSALQNHKNICISAGTPERHSIFRENIGAPDLDKYGKDSLFYESAYLFYSKNDCATAIKNFQSYLGQFPNGFFAANAHVYLAECLYDQKEYDAAAKNYEYILGKPQSEHTEIALVKTARIYEWKKDFTEAIKRYAALESVSQSEKYLDEAQQSLMRAYAVKGDNERTVEYAKKVLAQSKRNENEIQEANLLLGRSYLGLVDFENARAYFDKVVNGVANEFSAEAVYSQAYILNMEEQYDESSNLVYTLAKEYSNYQYWITKGFLVLADNFISQDDLFQAKYVVNTILENYEGEDLRSQAKDKLDAIIKMEETQNVDPKEEENIIDFGLDNETKELIEPEEGATEEIEQNEIDAKDAE